MSALAAPWALVKRELITNLRQGRTFGVAASFVAVCGAVAIFAWPDAEAPLTAAAALSRELVLAVSYALLAGTALFMPAYGALAISQERERETFDLLFLTLLNPLGILGAKLVNSLGFFVLLAVAALPILALPLFLVGLSWELLAACFAVSAVSALACAFIGAAASAWCRQSLRAIALAYCGVVAFMGLGPLVLAFVVMSAADFIGAGQLTPQGFGRVLGVASAPVVVSDLVSGNRGFGATVPLLIYALVCSAVCFVIALAGVRRGELTLRGQTDKPIDDPDQLRARRQQFPYYLIDPLRRKKPIENNRNPMMVKEIRWGLMNRGTVFIRIFYCAFLVYFISQAFVLIDGANISRTGAAGWMILQMYITVLVAPAVMANSLTKEFEMSNIDMLRMTLMAPREIVMGKVYAGALSLTPLFAASALTAIPAIYIGLQYPGIILAGYVTFAACAGLSLAIGLLASFVARRTSAALVLAYSLTVVLFFAGPAVRLAGLSWRWSSGDNIEYLAVFLSPIAAFEHVASDGRPLAAEWLAVVLAFSALALAMGWFTVQGFERWRMQDQ